MQVTPVSGAKEPANTKTAASGSDTLIGRDAFLQLLLAQLKYQDPLKPMESTEYVSQLAQLSNLEQSIKQGEKLDSILVASSLSQASSIVGQNVTSADGTISGKVVGARVTSEGVVAELASGKTLLVASGVKVSSG